MVIGRGERRGARGDRLACLDGERIEKQIRINLRIEGRAERKDVEKEIKEKLTMKGRTENKGFEKER